MLDFDSILWTKRYSDIKAIGLGIISGLVIALVLFLIAYFLL